MGRKGIKYDRHQEMPCPKCGYDTSETKALSMSTRTHKFGRQQQTGFGQTDDDYDDADYGGDSGTFGGYGGAYGCSGGYGGNDDDDAEDDDEDDDESSEEEESEDEEAVNKE